MNNRNFENIDNSKDPIIVLDQANARKIAAMASVVGLESLRGNTCEPHFMRIKTPPAHSEMSWGYTSDLTDFSVLGR